MERVLQWVDELEDLYFSCLLNWERLRTRCLQFGLMAAILLMVTTSSSVWEPLDLTLAAAASGSIGIWLVGLLAA